VTPFGARLSAAVAARGPLCVGIDPHPALLAAWGLADDSAGLERFARTVVEALAGHVAVLKPQSAFFERHGSPGIAVLERTLLHARSAGALVLLDVKRGDIGSTVQAYADAYLDPASPLCADAVTASPYLGPGSLQPLLDTARSHGGGVFVLALTSNPEGAQMQRAVAPDGRTVAGVVLDAVRAANATTAPLGSVGAVVGATARPSGGERFDIGGPLLVPGLGAQGGTADDLRRLVGDAASVVLPSTSRAVQYAGPDAADLRAAAERAAASYAAALSR
jgi:orotidine-5'-phosphate decarboxylase